MLTKMKNLWANTIEWFGSVLAAGDGEEALAIILVGGLGIGFLTALGIGIWNDPWFVLTLVVFLIGFFLLVGLLFFIGLFISGLFKKREQEIEPDWHYPPD